MTRRRSLRHLTFIAAASGVITLAVAVTGISPVWLAVGPLLLVLIDTLAYSPAIRRRLRAITPSTASSHSPAPTELPSAVAYLRGHIVLGVAGLLVLAVGVAASIVYLPLAAWLAVLSVVVVILAALGASLYVGRFTPRVGAFGAAFGQLIPAEKVSLVPDSPTHWLQAQLETAGEGPLSVIVVTFDGPVPAGLLADALATAALHGTRFHHLTANEFLLVGSSAAIHTALSLFGLGRFRLTVAGKPLAYATFESGEAVYPRDGQTAEALIAKARQARHRTRE